MRILSYGAGLDSTAILVLLAQNKIPSVDYVVFANTGEMSESPHTIEYVERYVKPYCEQHNIKFVEVQKVNRNGVKIDLLRYALDKDKSFPIVQYMSKGSPSNRTCTQYWKVKPIDKFLGKGEHTVLIGFSANEVYRLKNRENPQTSKNGKTIKYFEYPLIDLGITKDKAIEIVKLSGLPVPKKSACWFCPYGARQKVLDAKNAGDYELLQKWTILETVINKKREKINRDNMYFYPMTRGKMRKLSSVYNDAHQLELFEEICDSGYCGL